MAPQSRVWSQSPASLNSVFSVLNAYDHPFIVVGKYALRWMGVNVYSGYTVDVLVRTPQLESIYRAFVQTGEWLEFNESGIPEIELEFHRVNPWSVRKLKRCDDNWFLSLCDEDSCHIPAHTQKVQVPHAITYNCVLVESEFRPNSSDRRVGPYLLTDDNIKCVGDPPITFPVFIPTIPQFLRVRPIDMLVTCT
ncbi:hypothetical protein HOY82DRAFT_610970 [Tuber indicum]|nr:hypothetical protein HOY82DRAFT_610970 [Tuber indicum]